MFRPSRVSWMSHNCWLLFEPQDRPLHPYVCASFLHSSSMCVDIALFGFVLFSSTVGWYNQSPMGPLGFDRGRLVFPFPTLESFFSRFVGMQKACRRGRWTRSPRSCCPPLDLSRSSEGSVLPPFPIAHLTRRREERGSDFPVLGRVGTFLPLVTWKRSTWSSGATDDVWCIRNTRDTSQVERIGRNATRRTSTRSKQPWHPTTVDAVHTYRQGNDGEGMRRKNVE